MCGIRAGVNVSNGVFAEVTYLQVFVISEAIHKATTRPNAPDASMRHSVVSALIIGKGPRLGGLQDGSSSTVCVATGTGVPEKDEEGSGCHG